jgi:predicted ferric reductase
LLDLHRYLGGLATIFVGVHVAAIVADSYVHFDLVSILVPFASAWKPAGVACGVVAMYLVLAVELTSLARRHLPRRLWRMTHVASFPLFVSATVHGFTAGTDRHNMAYILAGAAVTVAVAGLTLRRIEQVSAPTPAPRRAVDRIAERAAA